MNRALIVYGYYDEDDHYGALLNTVKNKLKKEGINEIEVVNTFSFTKEHLNNNSQDFSASTAEWYRGLRTTENNALIKSEQDKILRSTHIIFIYPIWWESVPHYMLTWLSEVFRSVSFRVDGFGRPNPQWGGDRKVMIITTAGFSQEIRRENFIKLLPTQNLDFMKEKSTDDQDAFIHLSQMYPLITALNYAGLRLTKELHICDVDKGDAPNLLSAVNQGIDAFLRHVALKKEENTIGIQESKGSLIINSHSSAEPVVNSLKPPILQQFKIQKPKGRYLQRELTQLIAEAEAFKPQNEKRKKGIRAV